MKNLLLATVFAVVSLPAFAQNSPDDVATQSPTKGATAQYCDHCTGLNQNATTARAHVANSGNNTNTNAPVANGGTGGQGGAGGTARSHAAANGNTVTNTITTGSGGGGYRSGSVWDNPVSTAYAPSFAGANGCSGRSNSAGGGAAVISLTFGHQGMDDACRLEQARGNPVALALLCIESVDIRKAMLDVGTPCPADRPAGVPVAAAAPQGIKYQFDWCYTIDAGNVRQRKYCEAHLSS